MKQLEASTFKREFCPVFNAVNEIGDSWTILIIRECFLGTRRFDQFQQNLAISKSVLSTKVKKLVQNDILRKVAYQEGNQRQRFEYKLTQKGKDLYMVIISLLEWGNKYLTVDFPQQLKVRERKNGKSTHLSLLNKKGQLLDRRDIALIPFSED